MDLQSLDLFNFVNQYADMPSDLAKVKSVTITAPAEGAAHIIVNLFTELELLAENAVDSVEKFLGIDTAEAVVVPAVQPAPVEVVVPPVAVPPVAVPPVEAPVEAPASGIEAQIAEAMKTPSK